MKVLITGVAGFIGFSVGDYLLKKGFFVLGIDNLDDYYSQKLKKKRLNLLKKNKKFLFHKIDITKISQLKKISKTRFDFLFHFAAQPGVRYSLINPKKYYDVNIIGFKNIIENINKIKLKKIIYASSSSVYGDQEKFPTKENHALKAKNVYGDTKIINEKIAEVYNKVHKIPFIGLRLFTIYGEWGRPDMFIMKLINCNKKKKIFYLNKSGNHDRDFTYINDVKIICHKMITKRIKPIHYIFNVCRGKTENIKRISKKIMKIYPETKIKNIKANKADVLKTFGSNKKIVEFLGFKKFTDINIGLKNLVEWFEKNKIEKYI